jgi:hypothetical protein
VAKAKKIGRQVPLATTFRDVAAADRQASLRAADPSRKVCLSCTPMNASAANFLTQESAGVCANVQRAITQLPIRRAARRRRQGPKATRGPRVGGAKRRALHGTEHSSKLGCVMAAETTAEAKRGLRQPDDGEIRFPETRARRDTTTGQAGAWGRRRWARQAPTT